jgi:hypothetical protein
LRKTAFAVKVGMTRAILTDRPRVAAISNDVSRSLPENRDKTTRYR